MSDAWVGLRSYRPRSAFREFHARSQRWAVMVCHRRAGKTVACIADLVVSALSTRKQDARFAYIAPQHVQAKDVAWLYLLRMTADIRNIRRHETELRVDLPNGARIRLYGAENADRLRGLYLDGVVLDEYADMAPRVWGEVIRPLLADRRGWAAFIGTPKGHNSFFDVWRNAECNPEWFRMALRASESGLLPAGELAAARKDLTQDQYDQEFECSFEAAILGAYYGREVSAARDAGRITDVPYDPVVPVHTVWDLGLSDDTVILWYQVVRGEIHIIDHYEASGYLLDHYADVLKSKPYQYGRHWLPHDAQAKTLISKGKSAVEILGAAGVKGIMLVPNSNSEQQGIQAVRSMFPRLWIDRERCGLLVEALAQFQRQWDDQRKCFRDAPRKDWTNHSADAVRYLAWVWKDQPTTTAAPAARSIVVGGRSTVTMDDMWREAGRKKGGRI